MIDLLLLKNRNKIIAIIFANPCLRPTSRARVQKRFSATYEAFIPACAGSCSRVKINLVCNFSIVIQMRAREKNELAFNLLIFYMEKFPDT